MTLSHWAAHLNYPNLWKFLKSHNGISQQPDAKGMLPIHHACSSGAKEIFKDLIDSVDRSTLNARNRFGQTLLHLSIHHEDTDFAKKLLEKGVDPNIQDRNRETPLHYAR